jgi:ketosteroid isomerase-like protein
MRRTRSKTLGIGLLAAVGFASILAGWATSDTPKPKLVKTALASSDSQAEPSGAIRAVLTAQQTAWNQGNIPAFLKGYWNSSELTFASSEGIVRGYDGMLERYQKNYSDKDAMGELEFSGLEIRTLAPDAALVLGRWHLKRTKGETGGVFTLIFRRFPTGWRIVHDHTSAQK